MNKPYELLGLDGKPMPRLRGIPSTYTPLPAEVLQNWQRGLDAATQAGYAHEYEWGGSGYRSFDDEVTRTKRLRTRLEAFRANGEEQRAYWYEFGYWNSV